jgi:hypothetical protein
LRSPNLLKAMPGPYVDQAASDTDLLKPTPHYRHSPQGWRRMNANPAALGSYANKCVVKSPLVPYA